jgi:hypothetical protein
MPKKGKRTFNAESRAKTAAAQKARWVAKKGFKVEAAQPGKGWYCSCSTIFQLPQLPARNRCRRATQSWCTSSNKGVTLSRASMILGSASR